VEAALGTDYDAVVLDVMLPSMDGFTAARILRDRGVSTPILMLTARDSIDDRVAGLEGGADDYLVKPFAIRELLARVRALARRHLIKRSKELRFGSAVLDTGSRILTAAGQPVALTTKEYAILEYFLLNLGLVLSREQILNHVWNYDFEGGGDNLVEVYIGRLRRKLAEAGESNTFQTVRGAGYRLIRRS
jgi:DNA-binding response OmpR family regulator